MGVPEKAVWEGEIHTLIVHSVDEPVDEFDPGDLGYELEHPPSCPRENCDVARNEDDCGLGESLRYSGTPVTQPGTYLIRSWGRRYQTEEGDEYDGGVSIVPDQAINVKGD